MKRVGLKDVAAEAGVSVTTVSHILNNVQGKRINAETRRLVLEVAEHLGYQPNDLARGLRLRRSNTVGFVSDEIATTPHAGQIIRGAQEAAAQNGLMLLMLNTGNDRDLEDKEIALLLRHQVDGVLYASMYHRVVEVPQRLASVPTVLLDARSDDPAVPSVVPDEEQGGRTATRELLAHGHRRIGFVNNIDDIPASRGRLAGYRGELAEAGIDFDPSLVVTEDSVAAGGYRGSRTLLGLDDPPTALFCFNDRMAMGAYRAASEAGLAIPADLSVIGFDNQELISENLFPALTTVALPHYEMGARAIFHLQQVIDRAEPLGAAVHEVLHCPLISRDSVARPRT
ncbi:LacI family DNA-binding transcriptional regulator [Streptomyces cocklensis]|jgi:LacI family transcriptional regulator|uniref:LacI family transcriptional regulator n=2 Tax=Actinacidiphila cocklensis TaxID=887465 RepID=A0A9W4DNK3_9ACTN|nr:LacI family DNA-binding transcriptional regulator [Actinacidiphila cocklensis]CAG6394717.1 LacI family transcriptional regulator [Actinacidiphila cocklensis]